MTKDEALKLALEALEYRGSESWRKRQPAITAIKEALAQPEHCSDCGQKLGDANHIHTCSPQPKQDGKCKHCTDGCPACDARKLPEQKPVAYLLLKDGKKESFWFDKGDAYYLDLSKGYTWIPLYTTPPQPVIDESSAKRIATALGWEPKRIWIGLTDEEQLELYKQHSMDGWGLFYDAIEAKLKEKNT
jgi:hypothetical protein